MDLDIRQSGQICMLKVKGAFKSFDCTRAFDQAVDSALASGHLYVILDLGEMPMIDSSGIGAVVNALRKTKAAGGDTKLVNPSAFALKSFKMVGILSLFAVFDTEAEAMEACGS